MTEENRCCLQKSLQIPQGVSHYRGIRGGSGQSGQKHSPQGLAAVGLENEIFVEQNLKSGTSEAENSKVKDFKSGTSEAENSEVKDFESGNSETGNFPEEGFPEKGFQEKKKKGQRQAYEKEIFRFGKVYLRRQPGLHAAESLAAG